MKKISDPELPSRGPSRTLCGTGRVIGGKPLPVVEPFKARNWEIKSYINGRGTRHTDSYMVFFAEPKDPKKTAPTYGDILAFIDGILRAEKWNDEHLDRPPQLPRLHKLINVILRGIENGT